MTDKTLLARRLAELPIYQYEFVKTADLKFEPKVREICFRECPRYGKSWSCPPAVGTLDECREHCLRFAEALLICTVSEVSDISNMTETLSTRMEHERLTRRVRDIIRESGENTFVLSSESCESCKSCSYPDSPCRKGDDMFPCIESHCILVTELAEKFGIDFLCSPSAVTWFSLIFFD